MTYEENQHLIHYGIKGQKHGVRRYQNEDGSLTPEGIARYGNKKDYSSKDDGMIRTLAKSSFMGRRTGANNVVIKGKKKSDDFKSRANTARKSASQLAEIDPHSARSLLKKADRYDRISNKIKEHTEAQKKANADRKLYEDHTSTRKLVAQDFIFGKHGAQQYRAARARGSKRLRSMFESTAGMSLLGTVLAAKGNKKKYGKHIILGAPRDHEYDALALDRE